MKNYCLDVLAASAFFEGVDRQGLESMLHCLKLKVAAYNKNEYLVMAGEQFEQIGIMLKGTATVSKENAAGDRVVLTVLQPGEIFGEMFAFSDYNEWPVTVQAQESCQVFFLAREKIISDCERMCPWHRLFIKNFLKVISEKALLLHQKVEYLTIKSIRGKISMFLLQEYQKTGEVNLMLTLNRNQLADFLNVSRPSLSRELAELRDAGVIDFHLNTVRILDLEALKRIC